MSNTFPTTLVTLLVAEDGCDPRVAAIIHPDDPRPALTRARERAVALGTAIIADTVANMGLSEEDAEETREAYTLDWLPNDQNVLCVNHDEAGTEAFITIAQTPVES